MTVPNVEGQFPVPLEGQLEGESVPELLWKLSQARSCGSLILERDGARKVLFLRDGRVVFASSSDQEDRLGPFLLRRGQVGLATLLDAGGQVIRGRRLGQVLTEQGVMSQDEVVRAVLDQVREITLSVFTWRRGGWRLSRASLAQDEPLTLDLTMEELILAGIRRVQDWRWIRRAAGGPRAVYRVTPQAAEASLTLGLTERAILDQLERAARVDLLCREVYAPSYDVYRSLWALSILGLVERLDPALVSETFQGPGEGFIGRDGAAELFLRYGALELTGVLRLFHGSSEGAVFFREGRIEFATTNDPEQSLVVHLLRRGIISDQDHEIALRQLISGKRVGTLLAELGALGEEEVERFVREQVLDVTRSLVLWEEGEYQVDEGLPSEESVTLGWSAEDVVMEALETLEATERIWSGLGALDALFRLRPEYLDRLDRMRLRPEVWELVSMLRQEMTLAEILDKRSEPDFEVCRMLHALERVHVVEKVTVDEILARARSKGEQEPSLEPPQPASFHAPDAVAGDAQVEEPEQMQLEQDLAKEESSASKMAPELFDEMAAEATPFRLPAAWADLQGGAESAEPLGMDDDPWATVQRSGFELEEVLAQGQGEVESEPANETAPQAGLELEEREEPIAEEFVSPAKDPVEELPIESVQAPAGDPLPEPLPVPTPEPIQEELAVPVEEPAEKEPIEAELAAPVEKPAQEEPIESLEEPEPELLPEPIEAEPAAPVEEPAEEEPAESLEEPAEVDLGFQIGEMDPERTLELRREQIPAAFEEEPTRADLEPPPEEPALSVVPEEIQEVVAEFNRRHEVVFHHLRQEIGAGVRNYVLTCQKRLADAAVLFEGLSPDAKGCFDAPRLGSALLEHWREPWQGPLDQLIEIELDMVKDLMIPARFREIETALAALAED